MKKKGPITGTFIDEITYDIPASNWSEKQWRKDFDYMQEIGIDTVIFIRAGIEDKCVFPSKALGKTYCTVGIDDFAKLVFEETSKRNMDVFFSLHLSNLEWNGGDYKREYQINKPFVDEAAERYGDYPSFKGWYLPHECSHEKLNFSNILRDFSRMCKDKTPDKKVMISPYFKSPSFNKSDYFTPENHYYEWDKLFSIGGEEIDICAFQDGSAPMDMMADYFMYTKKVCDKYNIEHWVNVETFERDVRQMYFPIPFGMLKEKIKMHEQYAEKMVTFEFSHFLSPQSIFPSAQNLNNLYKEYYLK